MNPARFLLFGLGVAACARAPQPQLLPAGAVEPALPPLAAEALTEPKTPTAPAPSAPLTLRAVDADVRPLLVAIAELAGVNLVLAPEVRGKVSLTLNEVPARKALDALIAAAGLTVATELRAPWGPTVFYHNPVRLDTLSPEGIAQRFGVSLRLATWIAEQRGGRQRSYRPGEMR